MSSYDHKGHLHLPITPKTNLTNYTDLQNELRMNAGEMMQNIIQKHLNTPFSFKDIKSPWYSTSKIF